MHVAFYSIVKDDYTKVSCCSTPYNHTILEQESSRMDSVLIPHSAGSSISNCENYNSLRQAIQNQNKDIVLQLIQNGVKLNVDCPILCQSPLHLAVISRCSEIVRILLDAGADTAARDWNNDTPLTLAANMENRDLVDILLSYGIQNHANRDGLSHLHIACMMNRTRIIKKLISSDLMKNINKTVEDGSMLWPRYTSLHFAVRFGCIDAVEYLLECRADITAKDIRGSTPLHLADLQRNEKMIDLLLRGHKYTFENPSNGHGLTHFHIACTRDDTSVVQHFLDLGVDINKRVSSSESTPWSGWRPIDFAMYYKCTEVTKILLNAGVQLKNVNFSHLLKHAFMENDHTIYDSIVKTKFECIMSSEKRQVSAIFLACIQNNLGEMKCELLKLLNSTPSGINELIHHEFTLLHLAAQCDSVSTLKLLLEHGADVIMQNSKGETPIHTAFKHKATGALNFLLDQLKPPNQNLDQNIKDDDQLSIFHILCTTNKLQAIESFITNGVDINARVKIESTLWSGFTALHFASSAHQTNTISLLLHHHADISVTDAMDQSPVDLAIDYLDFYLSSEYQNDELLASLMIMIASSQNATGFIQNRAATLLHAFCTNQTTDLEKMKEYLSSHPDEISKVINLPRSRKYNECSPLHLAVLFNNYEQAKLLLENGADPFVKNSEGKTPFEYLSHYYRSHKWYELTEKCLLTHKTVKCLTSGVFHMACAEAFRNFIKAALDEFSDEGLRLKIVNCLDHYARTPLYSLIREYCPFTVEIIHLLIENGADVNVQDYELQTPLNFACSRATRYEDILVINLLLWHEANVNAKNVYGETPLVTILSSHMKHDEKLLNLLLNSGADLNSLNEEGQTYLTDLVEEMISAEPGEYSLEAENCIITCLKHVEKLRLIGCYVSDLNLEASAEWLLHQLAILDAQDDRFEVADYIEECKEELRSMEAVNIDRYTTLRNILSKNSDEMANHCENVDLQKMVKSKDFSHKYPIYESQIRLQMKYGKIRRSLLKESAVSLINLVGVKLSEPCSNAILRHLSDEELKNIIKSGRMS